MTPDDFPDVFVDGWSRVKPGPFLEFFLPLIHADATFTQPQFADAHGVDEIEGMFRRLFIIVPDLSVAVRRVRIIDDTVFIESDAAAAFGRGPIQFAVCDRFVLRDGLIVDRRSYSDPSPFLYAALRRPTSWPRLVRSRLRLPDLSPQPTR
jgi:hypothetical protein